ncbi:MAG: Maf family protein, partial [Candidatus Aminicenantes bacterium]|nr:Maf family protein [Candidatus Aminicenantes bacterium]
MRIILASSSPRRKELLSLIGLSPEIMVPNLDEKMQPGESV